MKFETFVRTYAAMSCPGSSEEFELVFSVYARTPKEYDPDHQDYYIKASWF
jgi:hypothetical protein